MKIILAIILFLFFTSNMIQLDKNESKSNSKNGIVIGDTIISKKSFPHGDLKNFRISKELNLSIKINEPLHSKLFHELNLKNKKDLHTPIPSSSSNEYLIDFRTVKVNERYQDGYKCNVITVLKRKEKSSRLYWLSFLAENYTANIQDTLAFKKGEFANYGVFAEKYQNDSINYESFSELINDSIIKKTTVKVHKNSSLIKDSTIYYFETGYGLFNDVSYYWKGEEKYRNDSLIRKDLPKDINRN